ncbi:hypothetical protein KZX70_09290 [Paenibacillus silvae]|uniref:hypothetical protein n=1 Tax=Paenibacillus silvae TaxID=1325358 RepID=UPI002005CBAF|nr:hypothetical protein [Paenibacillus silvae]MCK6075031.1 hypothetical protein [Paenibacillus silvae]MCK6149418.1 hypothetical protein [Paenibacillus silvae]MCK6267717.1 hypothetical protein [Paenibacillus silvae]
MKQYLKRLLCSMKLYETYTYECFQTKPNEEVNEEVDEELPAAAFHQPLVCFTMEECRHSLSTGR